MSSTEFSQGAGLGSVIAPTGGGSGVFDFFTGIASLYVQDRAAERSAPLQFAQWQQNNLMGIDGSITQNPNAAGGGVIGRGVQGQGKGFELKTEHLLIGGLALFGLFLVVR